MQSVQTRHARASDHRRAAEGPNLARPARKTLGLAIKRLLYALGVRQSWLSGDASEALV
jgi:hypothetical protein